MAHLSSLLSQPWTLRRLRLRDPPPRVMRPPHLRFHLPSIRRLHPKSPLPSPHRRTPCADRGHGPHDTLRDFAKSYSERQSPAELPPQPTARAAKSGLRTQTTRAASSVAIS